MAAFGAILIPLYHFEVMAWAIEILGLGLLAILIVSVAVTWVVLAITVPYYLITKTPEMKEGSYRLEEQRGK